MQAQLDGGIFEEERETTKHDKRTEAGLRGVANHYQNWGTERYMHKSLGDALFPTLENSMESEGFLEDITDIVADPANWHSGAIQRDFPAGTVVRITAPGRLFDARYIATVFSSFVATYTGLEGIGALPATSTSQGNKKPQRPAKSNTALGEKKELEDLIPDFSGIKSDTGTVFTSTHLRALVKLCRGLFSPGLHFNAMPTSDDKLLIGSRLQEGRQFLDGDPEILFARYGFEPQAWTIVGTVGHYSRELSSFQSPSQKLVDENSKLMRGRTSTFINDFLHYLGTQGFTDLPQYPGFSVVPLAVYRTIPSKGRTSLTIQH
ncbi:hypothetical protein ABGB14_36825 [Nonomuraea sp. B10E15]|uniref:DUF6414 family protein n=1 Tax=Nonomuraea sp. B10E15 TaxID=3153560 RepID=UPI00325EC3F7